MQFHSKKNHFTTKKETLLRGRILPPGMRTELRRGGNRPKGLPPPHQQSTEPNNGKSKTKHHQSRTEPEQSRAEPRSAVAETPKRRKQSRSPKPDRAEPNQNCKKKKQKKSKKTLAFFENHAATKNTQKSQKTSCFFAKACCRNNGSPGRKNKKKSKKKTQLFSFLSCFFQKRVYSIVETKRKTKT